MSADYQATDQLTLNFGVVYNHAEGSMDSINLTAPFAPAAGTPLAGFYNPTSATAVTAGDGWESRIPLVENYSDLEYSQLDVTLGGTYNFSERLYTSANLTYSDFDADEEYVYGDESGSAYYAYLGVGYRF